MALLKKYSVLILLSVLIAGGLWGVFQFQQKSKLLPRGGDFTADSSEGPFDFKELRGKYVFLYFGYTYCPDMCPMGLGFLSQAIRKLTPEEQNKVQFLFLTLDPERDDLPHLKDYLHFFHPQIRGLRTDLENLKKIANQYEVQFRKQGEGDKYTLDHTTDVYIIGPKGDVLEKLPHTLNGDSFLKFLRGHMK